MKIFGHPVHMMLIHFPSALFPMDFVCSVLHYYTGIASFTDASFYAMSGGVLLGWLAVLFGAFDLIRLYEKKPSAVKRALFHGSVNCSVVIIFTILAYVQYQRYPSLVPDDIPLLVIKGLTVGAMLFGNYLGGSLILKHHVAVDHA